MSNINDTIELIKKVIFDPNCARMNLSNVKGYLGELLVKAKLESEGVEVTHLGNQSGYDLELVYKGKVFKIDVKFSTLKCEYQRGEENWGWALIHQNKKREVTCTHYVCIAVDPKLEAVGYYVIRRENAELFLSGVGQFTGVKHSFMLFQNKEFTPNVDNKCFQLYETSKHLLDTSTALFVARDGSLLNALYEINNPLW
jgi:hypothetical protein